MKTPAEKNLQDAIAFLSQHIVTDFANADLYRTKARDANPIIAGYMIDLADKFDRLAAANLNSLHVTVLALQDQISQRIGTHA